MKPETIAKAAINRFETIASSLGLTAQLQCSRIDRFFSVVAISHAINRMTFRNDNFKC